MSETVPKDGYNCRFFPFEVQRDERVLFCMVEEIWESGKITYETRRHIDREQVINLCRSGIKALGEANLIDPLAVD